MKLANALLHKRLMLALRDLESADAGADHDSNTFEFFLAGESGLRERLLGCNQAQQHETRRALDDFSGHTADVEVVDLSRDLTAVF